MPRTKEITLYQFHELDDDAQERALDACRDINVDYGEHWCEHTLDIIRDVGLALGLELDNVYFQLSHSQGDGAVLEGSYARHLINPALLDDYIDDFIDDFAKPLRAIAQTLSEQTLIESAGLYQRGQCLSTRVDWQPDEDAMPEHIEYGSPEYNAWTDREAEQGENVTDAIRDFEHWAHVLLSDELEYQTSDDAVREAIEVSNFEFNEDGEPA